MKSGYAKGFFGRNKAVFAMGLAALLIAGTADLFAGLLLKSMEEYLLLIPGMMVLIYCAIGMRGNIFGAMGSRLGTAMHIGTFQMNFRKGGVLRANVESSMCMTLVLSVIMGITTWIVATWLFNGPYDVWSFVFISGLGGVMAGALVMAFNILIAKEGFKRDWDVDNITAPLIAAIGDIVTMPMIFVATWLYFHISDLTDIVIVGSSIVMLALSVVLFVRIITRTVNKRDFSGESKRILLNSVPILLFCLIFEIAAGIVIQNEEESLLEYAVLIVMLPAFLNEGNALSGMLTSRLSSMIHLGTVKPSMRPSRIVFENFLIMYICAVLTFAYIGLLAYLAAWLTEDSLGLGLVLSMGIIMIAGMLATTILNFLSYYVAVIATKFGLDPDDHSIPITSSVMDMVGAMVLVMVITAMI